MFDPPATHWLLLAGDASLPIYQRFARRMAKAVGLEVEDLPPHPFPEGKLYETNAKGERKPASKLAVVNVADQYIYPYIGHIAVPDPLGQPQVYRVQENLCKPVVKHAADASIADRLTILTGNVPTNDMVEELRNGFVRVGQPVTIAPLRFAGETTLAMVELPRPSPGPTPGWDQLLNRCSCADTVLAFFWTLTIPEDQTGRQALLLRGHSGHDGKSTVVKVIADAMAPAAVTVEKVDTKDNRFGMQSLRPYTRLLYLDDVRNKSILHLRNFRNMTAGGTFEVERKNQHAVQLYLHPRVLITTNEQLSYDISDRAEASRVLQVDVAPRSGAGDTDWPRRLAAELPALLHRAREAWERLHDGPDIRLTDATKAVMAAASAEKSEQFDAVIGPVLHICSEAGCAESHEVSSVWLRSVLNKYGLIDDKSRSKYAATDFTRYITARGAKTAPRYDRTAKKSIRKWVGIGLAKDAPQPQPVRFGWGKPCYDIDYNGMDHNDIDHNDVDHNDIDHNDRPAN